MGLGLAAKVTGLVVVAAVVTVAASVTMAWRVADGALRREAVAGVERELNGYLAAVSLYLDRANELLVVSAARLEAGPALGDSAGEIGAELLRTTRTFEHLALYRPDGSLRGAAPAPRAVLADVDDRPWFRAALAGAASLGDLELSPVTLEPTAMVAVPVQGAGGEVDAVWAGGLRLEELSRMGVTPGAPAAQRSHGYLTDRRGLVVAHQGTPRFVRDQTDFSSAYPVAEALAGRRGAGFSWHSVERRQNVSAWAPLPEAGWVAVHATPESVALGSVRQLTNRLVAGGGAAALGCAALAAVASRRMTAPLGRLRRATARVAAGDLGARAGGGGGDELAALAREFDEMAAALAAKDEAIRRNAVHLEQSVATATEELRRALALQIATLESTVDGIAAIDGDGRLTAWNGGFVALWAVPRDLLAGGDARAVAEHIAAQVAVPAVADLAGEAMSATEDTTATITLHDGRTVEVRSRAQLLDGNLAGRVWSFRDVTDRARAEAEIAELNRGLEARVADRTAELERAVHELDAFAYSVSHDLRAPLRSIAGFTAEVVASAGPALDDRCREDLARVERAAGRMGELIDDLLRLSRLGRAPMVRTTVDLSALALEVAGDLAAAEPERSVDLEVEPGLTSSGDPGLLRVVLEQLLANAWKFTVGTTAARVRVGAEPGEPPDFFVSDNGAGFDPRYADKLFAPFQRLHSATEFPGNGIGLATVQRIVSRHGGTLSATGSPGLGARFCFSIPDRSPQ